MATRPKHSEAETLEQYRVALENVVNQAQIATIMAEFGYDTDVITEGKTIWQTSYDAYIFNKTEDDETTEASTNFKTAKAELASTYNLHRKKSKVIFRKDALTLEKLGIKGRLPQSYIKWLEVAKKFYTVSLADSAIQAKLVRLKITSEDLSAVNTLVSDLETARSIYLREKGESQDATKAKDQALANIDDWMSEFYAVAEIALEDHPQLLESLSKVVKS